MQDTQTTTALYQYEGPDGRTHIERVSLALAAVLQANNIGRPATVEAKTLLAQLTTNH